MVWLIEVDIYWSSSKYKLQITTFKFTIFGMNRIYLGFEKWGFTPTYYVSINKLVLEQSAEEISKIPCPKFLSSKGIPYFSQQDDLLFVHTVNFQQPFSPNPLNGLNEGYTVTYFALQLAYYMGFETVVLIGVDHSFSTKGEANKEITSQGDDPNHFHPSYFGKGTRWQLPDLENSEKHYRLAEAHFRSDGRQIIDATVGGKCPVFPKADYRQLFFEDLSKINSEASQLQNSRKLSAVLSGASGLPFHDLLKEVDQLIEAGKANSLPFETQQSLKKAVIEISQSLLGSTLDFPMQSELYSLAQSFQKLLDLSYRFCPQLELSTDTRVDLYVRLAQVYSFEGHYKQTISTYYEAIKISPVRSDVYLGLSATFNDYGEFQNSIRSRHLAQKVSGN
jgi:hypothetical protein